MSILITVLLELILKTQHSTVYLSFGCKSSIVMSSSISQDPFHRTTDLHLQLLLLLLLLW